MNCIFCKIASKEVPAAIIYEDDKHMAFLDQMPSRRGQALVIPKEHKSSKFSDNEDSALKDLIAAAKKVAKLIETSLDMERCVVVIEGYGVQHLHVKLYPFAKGAYEGQTTTATGPKADPKELAKLAKAIKKE